MSKIAVPTLARLRRMIAKGQSIPVRDVEMAWIRKAKLVKCPTGVMAVLGSVMVSAPGFRSREMQVNADESGILLH